MTPRVSVFLGHMAQIVACDWVIQMGANDIVTANVNISGEFHMVHVWAFLPDLTDQTCQGDNCSWSVLTHFLWVSEDLKGSGYQRGVVNT